MVQISDSVPYDASIECPVCRTALDPLRAPRLLAFDNGSVALCSDKCVAAMRAARKQGRRTTPPGATATPGEGIRGEELTLLHSLEGEAPEDTQAPSLPAASLVLVAGAAALAAIPTTGTRVAAVGLLAAQVSASLLSNRSDRTLRLSCGLAAASTLTLCAAAMLDDLGPRYLLAAAAATLVGVMRPWLEARGRRPLAALNQSLRDALPSEVRVPLDEVDDPATTPSRDCDVRRVHTGDRVLVREGETLGVDGVIQVGTLTVLPTTASRTPFSRGPGTAVLAGARVLRGDAAVLVTRVGQARAIAQASHIEGRAEGAITDVIDRSGRPATIAIYALSSLAIAVVFGPASGPAVLASWGIALLCYPLLGLTRGVHLPRRAATATAVQHGMVFRDAQTLDDAGRVSAVALSADGTVTEDERVVTEVLRFGHEMELSELAALAMGLQRTCDEHPIAQAVAAYGNEHGFAPRVIRRASYVRGRGVTALSANGQPLVMGNRALLLSAGVSVAVAEREAQGAEGAGRSVVFLAVDDRVRALFVLDYQLRPQARGAVQTLIDMGPDVALLSGDHRATVESFASKLDITHVRAELNADDRSAEVVQLRETGGVVAAIGRLPDDEGALAEADVAVALNAAGSSAADIGLALATDDIADASRALAIARWTYLRSRRAAWVALGGSGAVALLTLSGAGPLAVWPLVLLGLEAWTLPNGATLLARLRALRIVGSVRPAAN